MALFVWKCSRCGTLTRKILPTRPTLGACGVVTQSAAAPWSAGPCGGELNFVSNTSSQTMEVIDNGLMARVLERPANIEEKIAARNSEAEKEDDPVI